MFLHLKHHIHTVSYLVWVVLNTTGLLSTSSGLLQLNECNHCLASITCSSDLMTTSLLPSSCHCIRAAMGNILLTGSFMATRRLHHRSTQVDVNTLTSRCFCGVTSGHPMHHCEAVGAFAVMTVCGKLPPCQSQHGWPLTRDSPGQAIHQVGERCSINGRVFRNTVTTASRMRVCSELANQTCYCYRHCLWGF